MRTPAAILLIACTMILLAAGCADTSFGALSPTDFGSSAEEQQAVDWFKAQYGEPGQPGNPRFIEPVITTGLDTRNLPVDNVVQLKADTPKVYFWVFYDRFSRGDIMELSWVYVVNGKTVLTAKKEAGGVYGRVSAGFEKPEGGWPAGEHRITVTSRGVTASKSFMVTSGPTATEPLPYAGTPVSAPVPGSAAGRSSSQAFATAGLSGTRALPATGATGQAVTASRVPFTGCWILDSSRCGLTQAQLMESGSGSAGGYLCDGQYYVEGQVRDETFTGQWWLVYAASIPELDCCHMQYGQRYCDPFCLAAHEAQNTAAASDRGSIALTLHPADKSLAGTWSRDSDSGSTPVSGIFSTACGIQLQMSGSGGQSAAGAGGSSPGQGGLQAGNSNTPVPTGLATQAAVMPDPTGCWITGNAGRIHIDRTVQGTQVTYSGYNENRTMLLSLGRNDAWDDRRIRFSGECTGWPCVRNLDPRIQQFSNRFTLDIVLPPGNSLDETAGFYWVVHDPYSTTTMEVWDSGRPCSGISGQGSYPTAVPSIVVVQP